MRNSSFNPKDPPNIAHQKCLRTFISPEFILGLLQYEQCSVKAWQTGCPYLFSGSYEILYSFQISHGVFKSHKNISLSSVSTRRPHMKTAVDMRIVEFYLA